MSFPHTPQTYLDMSRTRQHAGRSQHSTGGERHHSNMNWVHDMADDLSSIQDSLKTHDEGNYERSIRGSRHGRIGVCVCVVKICRDLYYLHLFNKHTHLSLSL